MIVDETQNVASYYGISKRLDLALRTASQLGADTELGRHALEGDALYYNVMEYTPKSLDDGMIGESHDRYADLQLILQGDETFGYLPRDLAVEHESYDPDRDIAFWRGDYARFALRAGQFALVFPQDVHAPSYQGGSAKVKKAVFKIRLD